jgi:hypothetical protein
LRKALQNGVLAHLKSRSQHMAAFASTHYKPMEYWTAERSYGDCVEDTGALGPQDLEPAIDLVHLARQTLSDQTLEVELLDMFDRQSARIVAQLADSPDAKVRGDLAHTLRGSALAVGAGRVARTVEIYEAACVADLRGGALKAMLDAVNEAVVEARATIANLRA